MIKDIVRKESQEKDLMKQIKENKRMIALGLFVLLSLVMIILSICVLKVSVVPICALVIIQAALAVMMHEVELWIHGVLILAEVIAGILTENVVLIIFCAVLYVAATVTLKVFETGEK